MSSRSSIAAMVFGGVTILSLSFLCYYYFFSSVRTAGLAKIKDKKKLDDEEEEAETDEIEEEEVDEEKDAGGQAHSPMHTNGTAEQIDEAAALKAQYDRVTKESTALINAQNYEEAVHKLTEAITLAPHVPFASMNLVTLYNNRSAMYEKLQQYEHSLRDITVVLTMEPMHMRARVRRARVYEAQGKGDLALLDYVFASLVDKYKGEQSAHEGKVATLAKQVALSKVAPALAEIRNNKNRSLPSKAYLRTFLEAYPSIYSWRVAYEGADRDSLAQAFNAAKANTSNASQILITGLEVIRFDIVHEAMTVAMTNLHSLEEAVKLLCQVSPAELTLKTRSALSQYHELLGTEAHLKADLDTARMEYDLGLLSFAENLSCQLKLVSLFNDLGDIEAAMVMIGAMLSPAAITTTVNTASYTTAEPTLTDLEQSRESIDDETAFSDARSSPPTVNDDSNHGGDKTAVLGSTLATEAVRRSWSLIHRASLWIGRDANGKFQDNAIENALTDLDEAHQLVENLQHIPEAAGADFISLLKSVHVLTHTKQTMEQPHSEEDSVRCREAITKAKTVFPDHESVLLMEAEQLSQEGESSAALRLLEKAKRRARRSQHRHIDVDHDVTFIVTRASVVTAQAFAEMAQNNVDQALTLFKEVTELYEHALEIEPNAIEVMAQLAQLKSMLSGDVGTSVELLQRAVPLARSREEVQDLMLMLVINEAQFKAVQEMQAYNGLHTVSGRSV